MIQIHPADTFDVDINFWQEWPSFKIHKVFGEIYRKNRKENLKNSSSFMWLLSLCYDRKSALYTQPEQDKWEAASEQLFNDEFFMINLVEEPYENSVISIPDKYTIVELILEFESAIDTPLGLSLKRLERKLIERTGFITSTKYTVDFYEKVGNKNILRKGTADQLDRMFAATDKINNIIQTAMDKLRVSEAAGKTKGDQKESLSDGDKNF